MQRSFLAGPSDNARRARRGLPPNAPRKETAKSLVRNRKSLERVNKALGILRSDTTELTAALNNLQQTVQRQIQAEQTIGTLADGVEALAKGDITPFEFQDRFGVPISAFEKLKEATLTGKQDTIFGFDEVQALRKALTGGSSLLDAPLRALAETATSPGGRAFADPRFKNDPEALLASLRADFTALAGKGALQSLQGRQVGPQIIGFLQDALGLQAGARQQAGRGGAQAIEVQRILREQRNLIEATGLSDQALFSAQMTLATRSFSQATDAFATAVANFEIKVAPPGADPGAPGAGGGPVGNNNRGGLIQRFAKGGRVRGPSHAQGGVLAELEGGEYVIPKAMQGGGFDNLPGRPKRTAELLDSVRENLIKSFGEDAQGFAAGGLAYLAPGGPPKGRKAKSPKSGRRGVFGKMWDYLSGKQEPEGLRKALLGKGPKKKAVPATEPFGIHDKSLGRQAPIRDPLHLVEEITREAQRGTGVEGALRRYPLFTKTPVRKPSREWRAAIREGLTDKEAYEKYGVLPDLEPGYDLGEFMAHTMDSTARESLRHIDTRRLAAEEIENMVKALIERRAYTHPRKSPSSTSLEAWKSFITPEPSRPIPVDVLSKTGKKIGQSTAAQTNLPPDAHELLIQALERD